MLGVLGVSVIDWLLGYLMLALYLIVVRHLMIPRVSHGCWGIFWLLGFIWWYSMSCGFFGILRMVVGFLLVAWVSNGFQNLLNFPSLIDVKEFSYMQDYSALF